MSDDRQTEASEGTECAECERLNARALAAVLFPEFAERAIREVDAHRARHHREVA